MSKPNKPALIVFGKRHRKQPRAAWFAATDAAVARWIANRHGLSILRATTKVMNELGNPVAEWQLTDGGEQTIPTIRLDAYEQLQALAAEADASGGQPNGPTRQTGGEPLAETTGQQREAVGVLWGALAIGSLVLAQEDDPRHGWWEAIILAMHQNTFTLCWRDHPMTALSGANATSWPFRTRLADRG